MGRILAPFGHFARILPSILYLTIVCTPVFYIFHLATVGAENSALDIHPLAKSPAFPSWPLGRPRPRQVNTELYPKKDRLRALAATWKKATTPPEYNTTPSGLVLADSGTTVTAVDRRQVSEQHCEHSHPKSGGVGRQVGRAQ